MHRLPCALLITGLLAQASLSQDQPPQSKPRTSEEAKHIEAILAAEQPFMAAEGYGALFKAVGPSGLAGLRTHANDSIAIQAAWEEVELTLPGKDPMTVVRPNRDKLVWFLGFLEGRGRLQIPKWWSEAILDARANRRGNVYAGGLNTGKREKAVTALPPSQASIEMLEGKLVMKAGATTVPLPPLPEDIGEKIDRLKPQPKVSALVTSQRCYMAAHDGVGFPYKLACIDRASGKLLWVSEVWASWWGFATGKHFQWVEVSEQDNRVIVFGVATTGFHVEAFQIEDGKNLFRFSNTYSSPE